MEHKELLSWLKEIYVKVKTNDFEWKPIYRNVSFGNSVDGIYTDMFFEKDGSYTYVKYSIQYVFRCDSNGITYPTEGVKYYVLHELQMNGLDKTWEIPVPSKAYDFNHSVYDYGKFRYVFEDVQTAESVAAKYILNIVYSFTHLLRGNELEEWVQFTTNNSETGDMGFM